MKYYQQLKPDLTFDTHPPEDNSLVMVKYLGISFGKKNRASLRVAKYRGAPTGKEFTPDCARHNILPPPPGKEIFPLCSWPTIRELHPRKINSHLGIPFTVSSHTTCNRGERAPNYTTLQVGRGGCVACENFQLSLKGSENLGGTRLHDIT